MEVLVQKNPEGLTDTCMQAGTQIPQSDLVTTMSCTSQAGSTKKK